MAAYLPNPLLFGSVIPTSLANRTTLPQQVWTGGCFFLFLKPQILCNKKAVKYAGGLQLNRKKKVKLIAVRLYILQVFQYTESISWSGPFVAYSALMNIPLYFEKHVVKQIVPREVNMSYMQHCRWNIMRGRSIPCQYHRDNIDAETNMC